MRSRPAHSPSETRQSEQALLRQIRSRAARTSLGALRLGIGDDCALLRPRRGEELAVTTDLSIAGRHFRLDWHPAESIGHRALARGLSDLAAMGARPVAAFLSLGLPRELTVASGRKPTQKSTLKPIWIERFFDGLLALAEAHKTPLAGGDLSESPLPIADIVLIGAVPRGKALLRSTARPGDLLYVTGSLGGAAAALARLEGWASQAAETGQNLDEASEKQSTGAKQFAKELEDLKGHGFKACPERSRMGAVNGAESARPLGPEGCFSSAKLQILFFSAENTVKSASRSPRIPQNLAAQLAPHLYPQPRVAQGLWLVRHGVASAAIDLSDGLSTDLTHICEESGVAAEVDSAALPIHPGATLAQALNGGEDYELLFTASPTARLPRKIAGVPITQIGRILKSRSGRPAVTLLTPQGRKPLAPQGWEHFV